MEITIKLDAPTFAIALGKRGDGPTKHVEVELAKLAPAALEAIFLYGMQRRFNDAAGGSDKTVDDKVKIVTELRDNFYAGIVRKPRATGSAEEPWRTILRQLVRENLSDKQRKEYKDVDAEKRNDWLDDVFDGFEDEMQQNYVEFAKEMYDRQQAEKAAKAAGLAKLKGKLGGL